MEQTSNTFEDLSDLANELRIKCIEMCEVTDSGHPTSCASLAEIIVSLFFHENGMKFDAQKPNRFDNDKFILSKGHAAPILYAAWAYAGFLTHESLLTLRLFDSKLDGHPLPIIDFVDVPTGSLGIGLSNACGMAYASKYIDHIDNYYYVVMGDAEVAEGSVWEACNFASFYKLDNLVGIVDVNALGQSGYTMFDYKIEEHQKRFESFGWEVYVVDGHNIQEFTDVLKQVRNPSQKPKMILAKTLKGKNLTEKVENKLSWHGKPMGSYTKETINYINQLIKNPVPKLFKTYLPERNEILIPNAEPFSFETETEFQKGNEIPVRQAYGTGLCRLSKNDHNNRIMALDADTKNSTMSLSFYQYKKDYFIECFVAEQVMIGVQVGLATRGKITFSSTFGAFYTRAYDQIRMAGIGKIPIKLCGSHSGSSINRDGPSQMGLEDIGLFAAIPDSIILYPSDAVSMEQSVLLAANINQIVYIRSTRAPLEVIYDSKEKFEIGKAKILFEHENDELVIATSGYTLHEAKKAVLNLQQKGIHVCLVDLFSLKPLDTQTLINLASKKNNSIYTVEDHYRQGGIHSLVSQELSETGIKIYGTQVHSVPKSGSLEDLANFYNYTAEKIQSRVEELIDRIKQRN